jgi:hypothetical protein
LEFTHQGEKPLDATLAKLVPEVFNPGAGAQCLLIKNQLVEEKPGFRLPPE